MQKWSKKRAVS